MNSYPKEKLKKILYESIEKNGLTASLTIELSQKLDPYMVSEQRKMLGGN